MCQVIFRVISALSFVYVGVVPHVAFKFTSYDISLLIALGAYMLLSEIDNGSMYNWNSAVPLVWSHLLNCKIFITF